MNTKYQKKHHQKHQGRTKRNWFLVFFATIVALVGLFLVWVAVVNISALGWLSLGIGVLGGLMATMAITSIVKHDPSWVLLDIILPF